MIQSTQSGAQSADKELIDPGAEEAAAWGAQSAGKELSDPDATSRRPSVASSSSAEGSHGLGHTLIGRPSSSYWPKYADGCGSQTSLVILDDGATTCSSPASHSMRLAASHRVAFRGRCCSYRKLGIVWGSLILFFTIGIYTIPSLLKTRGYKRLCLASPDDPAARSSLGMTMELQVAGATMVICGAVSAWIHKSASSDHLWGAARVTLVVWVTALLNFVWFVVVCNEGRYDFTLAHVIGFAYYFVGIVGYVCSINMVTKRLMPFISTMGTLWSLRIAKQLQWSARWLVPTLMIFLWLMSVVGNFMVGRALYVPLIVTQSMIVAAYTAWACLPLLSGIGRTRWLAEHSDGQLAKEGRWAHRALRVQLLGLVLVQGSSIGHTMALALGGAAFTWRSGRVVVTSLRSLDMFFNGIGTLAFAGAFTGAVRGEAELNQKAITAVGKRLRLCSTPPQAREPDRRWDATVKALARRGFTLRALLRLFAGLGTKYMPHYDPERHSTADVVRQAIIPLSREVQSAAAEVIMRGRTVRPVTMVTHTWSGLFVHLVAGICAHALGIVEYGHIVPILLQRDLGDLEEALIGAGALDATFWVCALSVNQHTIICGANPRGDRDPVTHAVHPVCDCSCHKITNTTPPLTADGKSVFNEVNKFSDMMKDLARESSQFEQLILVDERFWLFTRAWCMAEIATAHDIGMPQGMVVLGAGAFDRHREEMRSIRIEDMEAAEPQDKEDILEEVGDTGAFDRHLNELLFKDLFQNWLELDSVCQVMRISSTLWVQRMLVSSGCSTPCPADARAAPAEAP